MFLIRKFVVQVKRFISLMRELDKYPLEKRSSSSFEIKVQSFQKLFDVCTCKCFSEGISDRNQCECKFSCKIPAVEWDFWVDLNISRKCIMAKLT